MFKKTALFSHDGFPNAASEVQIPYNTIYANTKLLECIKTTCFAHRWPFCVGLLLNWCRWYSTSAFCEIFFFMFQLFACFYIYDYGIRGVGHHWYHIVIIVSIFFYIFYMFLQICMFPQLWPWTLQSASLAPFFFQRSEKGELGMFWFVHTNDEFSD